MIGKGIEDRASGFEQVFRWEQRHLHSRRPEGDSLSNATGAEKHSFRRRFPEKWLEDFRVASVCGGVVIFGSAAWIWKGRLIHELGCSDASASALCVCEERLSLLGSPHAFVIPGACADGNGGNDLRVGGTGKIDYAFPLRACKHSSETCGRLGGGGLVVILKVCAVRPCATDPDVGRTQRFSQLAQPRIGKIDGRTILKHGWADADLLIGIVLCFLLFGFGGRRRVVGLPEPAAGDLDHLDVVREIAGVNRAQLWHRRRIECDCGFLLRGNHCCERRCGGKQ